jgi:hypothetical protein
MKKSNVTRSTAECSFDELNPKFIEYLKSYCETNKLDNIEKEVLHCFVTTNLEKGFFGGDKTSYTIICITKRFLFWGIIFDKKDTGIAAAQWNEISEIHDWETSESGKLVEDHGIEIFGFIYMWSRRSSWFIGLGDDDAGKRCRRILKDTIPKS